jgi:hypothetical protein
MIAARADAVQELAGSLGMSALENRYPGSGRGGGGNVAAAAAAAEGSVGGLAGRGPLLERSSWSFTLLYGSKTIYAGGLSSHFIRCGVA